MTTLFPFSLPRATRLLTFALEGLIVAGLLGRLLGYVRPPAWDHLEGRVYGALLLSLIFSFPLLLLLQLCALPFASLRRFALWGLVRVVSYFLAMLAIVAIFSPGVY